MCRVCAMSPITPSPSLTPDVEQSRSPLRDIPRVRPLYMLPADPFHEEVLIPAFNATENVACMMGFFTSGVLASLAPGLATYIARTHTTFRLLISPYLSTQDAKAIEAGMRTPHEAAVSALQDLVVTQDALASHTLTCLSWLLQRDRMEIRVALMKNALFHPKVWLFTRHSDVLAAHGSSNMTPMGLHHNVEQVAVSRSWHTTDQHYITSTFLAHFDTLWHNRDRHCHVLRMPDAIRQRIINTYETNSPPTEDDLRRHLAAVTSSSDRDAFRIPEPEEPAFRIPSHLRYADGPYAHQGEAVAAWRNADGRGILEMATGSGKTITALICAHQLYENRKPLFIVVSAPYVPILQQWFDEMTAFGLRPINLSALGGRAKRGTTLRRLAGRLRTGLSDVESVVISHDMLCTEEFRASIAKFGAASLLLIADESHHLGRGSFINDPPSIFTYRLGLSATPDRQYDPVGTAKLQEFLGEILYRFPLCRAIGTCLVEYDYYIHPAYLTEEEMEEWYRLTQLIRTNAWRTTEGRRDDYLERLFRDRRRLLETASHKLSVLRRLLDAEDRDALRHTLIYASDKAPSQLTAVNALLSELGFLFHPITANETSDRHQMRKIIKSFQQGHIQILTAKRVLDEGVNIPQISTAFILASTTVERQWTQRRGRLLRKSPDTGKTHSVIHDLVALPSPGTGDDRAAERSLVSGELSRVEEFASLARNAGRPDGPLEFLHRMARVAYL